ncbi:B12-binding domain-containing protein [Thermodesulfobacteriota bacterium]
MAKELVALLADLKIDEAIDLVQKSLDGGVDPMEILGDAKEGMKIVGDRFAEGNYFIPELIFSGEILKRIAEILEPHMKAGKEGESEAIGKVVFGTVKGDIHDIGKDLVVFMLETNGFEVIDLGIDVPVEKFVEAVKESGAKIVGLSGFLTLAFESMKETIEALTNAGLRDQVKVMIGGGQIDEDVKNHTGADAFGLDAMDAVKFATQWIGG